VWYQLVPTLSGDSVQLGAIELEWQRSLMEGEKDICYPVRTRITIPSLKVNTAPFTVKIDVPPFAVVGNITLFSILIHNHTDVLQEFTLAIKETNAFLFSGDKQSTFSIHPHSSHTIKHNLLPTTAGRQPLPHFQVISKRLGKELPQTKQTRYIFINPGHWINKTTVN